MSLVGDGGGEEDLCHVRSGGHIPQWGMVEERRIYVRSGGAQ